MNAQETSHTFHILLIYLLIHFPFSADGDKKQMYLPTLPPPSKIQTQISFCIYKHWGVSKFTSLGCQSQERFGLGGPGIEQASAEERLPLWALPMAEAIESNHGEQSCLALLCGLEGDSGILSSFQ